MCITFSTICPEPVDRWGGVRLETGAETQFERESKTSSSG